MLLRVLLGPFNSRYPNQSSANSDVYVISRKGFVNLLCRHYAAASSSSMENIPYMTVVLIVFTSVVYRFNIRVKHWHTAYLGLSPSRAKVCNIVEHKVGFLLKSWK